MADSVVIPQLHLFSSHRHHRSPTKDYIDSQAYKVSRNMAESHYRAQARRPVYLHPPSHIAVPYPVQVPIPVPVPVESAPTYIPNPHLELRTQFVRAPTTYVDYAEQFLMGRPSPILPSLQTARFSHCSSRGKKQKGARCQCQLDCSGPHQSLSKNIYFNPMQENKKQVPPPKIIVTPAPAIKKDPYFDLETQRERKRMEEEQRRREQERRKREQQKQNQDNLKEILGFAAQKSRQKEEEQMQKMFKGLLSYGLQMKKQDQLHNNFHSLFEYANDMSEKNKMAQQERQNLLRGLLSLAQQKCRESERKKFLENLIKFAEQRRKQRLQKEQIEKQMKAILNFAQEKYRQNRQQISSLKEMIKMGAKKHEQQMRKEVLIEKFMRKIPVTLDSRSLHEIIRSKIEQFNSIKLDFEDLPTISLDGLVEMKEQYMENSRNILLRLNDLAGDRTEVSLMYKLLKSQDRVGMVWPDL